MAMYGVKMPLGFLMFQLLYLLKYREFVSEKMKQLCFENQRRIGPADDDNLGLNDFGVYIGHQIFHSPDPGTDNNPTNDFGDVYTGIQDCKETFPSIKEINNINKQMKSETQSYSSKGSFVKELVLSAKTLPEIY